MKRLARRTNNGSNDRDDGNGFMVGEASDGVGGSE